MLCEWGVSRSHKVVQPQKPKIPKFTIFSTLTLSIPTPGQGALGERLSN